MNNNHQHNRGAALLLLVIFATMGSLLVVLGIAQTAYSDHMRAMTYRTSAQAYYAAESGVEDVTYRLMEGMSLGASEALTLNGATATTTHAINFDTATVQSESSLRDAFRTSRVGLRLGGGVSFSFGLQSHTGGITMQNSSEVVGNVYSNGTVVGAGSNMIYGDVVSAGPTGLVSGIHATGSAYAHTIQSSTVQKNAYYQTIAGTIVNGMSFPGSPDQPIEDLPIDDDIIDDWKTEAEAGGTISGPCPGGVYTIDTDTTIGPVKILCDVVIDKSSTDVTLAGPIWIVGNFETKSGPNIQTDPANPNDSQVIVVDDPADRIAKSQIVLSQTTGFIGTSDQAYILVISMNEDSSLGGSEVAIEAGNRTDPGAQEVIYYAPYGKLAAGNSVKLRGATAHQISLRNSASVEYETGMRSLLFSGGPSGTYVISSWNEVP